MARRTSASTLAAPLAASQIRAKETQQGRQPDGRVDLRVGLGPNDQLFLLSKADDTIRLVAPQGREE